MPSFVEQLLGGLIKICGSIAGRVLVALGIGVVTYTGIGTALDQYVTNLISSLQSVSPDTYTILKACRVGEGLGIIVGAITGRLTITGLMSDTFKKWVVT